MAKATLGHAAPLFAIAVSFFGRPAHAADPADPSSPHLRPARHLDHLGRTLEDVCPERTPGQRRCFSQRVVATAGTSIQPAAPPGFGFGFGDPNCVSMGGGGGSSPFPGSMAPKDVLAAYKIPTTTKANGKIVALVELPSVHGMDDVNAYRKAFGIPELPACPTDSSGVPTPGTTACFARVGEDGTVNSVTMNDCAGWSGETGLDMDMVSAACPDCSIVLVEATSSGDLDKMNTVAATVLHAAAASNSWGGVESGYDDPSPYQSPGILTLAASGDSGYEDEGEAISGPAGSNFPASVPAVIAVGGTTLSLAAGGGYTEVAWNDGTSQRSLFGSVGVAAGGSGCSQEFDQPAWQASSGFSFGSCMKRASVDLSAAAQFNPSAFGGGIAAYDTDSGGWSSVEGTSAATPLVAAIMVRLGLAGTDNHELFYKSMADFNDVTSGDNDNESLCQDVMCKAGKGWDGPTGLGTPNGALLVQLVGGAPSADDAGMTTATDDAGTPTPMDDASMPSTTTTGSASQPEGGLTQVVAVEASTGQQGAPTGAACNQSTECASPDMCASPGTGQAYVCAPACDAMGNCPNGYSCQSGFCFAAPADFVANDGYSSQPKGCSSSDAPSPPWSGAEGIGLGLLAVGLKRRRAARP